MLPNGSLHYNRWRDPKTEGLGSRFDRIRFGNSSGSDLATTRASLAPLFLREERRRGVCRNL